MSNRSNWDNYFLDLADLVATRATCTRAKHGAVLVRDNRVKSAGYNGSPSGMEHCTDAGCLVIDGHCERTLHAEVNCIMESTPSDRKKATLYITAKPCHECARLIANTGIERVVFRGDYSDDPLTDVFLQNVKVSDLR